MRMGLRLRTEIRDQKEALEMKTQETWEDAYTAGSSGQSGSRSRLASYEQPTQASQKVVVWERLAGKRYTKEDSSSRRPVSAGLC